MKLHNFRDLGGLTTKCSREIKKGLLYRTGNVAHWSDSAAEHVVKVCGVKTYIDLRKGDEVLKFGEPTALLKQNVEWKKLSIDTSDSLFESLRLPKANDWLELYQRLFEKNLSTFSKFAKIVAEAQQPILYGCLFGKDRTGIATSVLLNLLDVHDQHIVADYAKTTEQVRPLSDLFRDMLDHRGANEEELFEHFSRSHEAVMLGFLEFLRTHTTDHPIGREMQFLSEKYQAPLKKRLLVSP